MTDGGGESLLTRFCRTAAESSETSGASIVVIGPSRLLGSLASTDRVASRLEELQFSLGEGPCLDAHREGRPVLVSDLGASADRWPALVAALRPLPLRAVFAFPLVVDGAALGALAVHRRTAGDLTDAQTTELASLATVVGRYIVAVQSTAGSGTVAPELDVSSDFHLLVHQATGMVSVQLGVTPDEAFVRLCGYAFAHETPITTVAEAVVGRRLHFPPP